ncbi:hypothetical protein MMC34_004431 [Xylographa carneopallida]|nr:hypothetical protein [Xylographa carneopallida]
MVTFTLAKDHKVSIGLFEGVVAPGGRTLRRTKKRISRNSVHAPSQEVLPTAPPEPPKAATPPPVTEPTPVIETAPGWTAEDDGCLLEIHRIGVLLAGKQGIKERYKQLTKDDAAKTNDAAEKVEEKAPVEEPATEWTAEDDEQMAKLKKEKKSWKEIEDALGGKKGAKARYKEVNKDAAAGNDTDNEAEEKSKGPSKSNSLVMTDDELERTPSFSGQAIKPVVRLEDGEELSYDEARIYMIYLCRLQEFFEAEKWVNVASKFFDKTGKRIEATELRAKLSCLWTESLPVR